MNKVLAHTHKANLEGCFFWQHESGTQYIIAGYGPTHKAAWRDALRRHNAAKKERFSKEKKERAKLRKARGW